MPNCSSTHRTGSLATRLLPVHVALGALLLGSRAHAQTPDSLLSPGALKNMSLEQLMAIEVSSVSRRPERLSETASAIQVITRDDIRRSGATRLPEALRLATNLEVAQLDASQWAISARGFNSPLANKLLVLIDGRTVYSPLFAGVFWDAQDVLLEDVEQIEVVSGPGAALWGANAVNGVINISTQPAKDTRGLLAVAGGGTELHGLGAVRYGGAIGSKAHARVYGKYSDRDGTALRTGEDVPNDWDLAQGGFRLDWDASTSQDVSNSTPATGTSVALPTPSLILPDTASWTCAWAGRLCRGSRSRSPARISCTSGTSNSPRRLRGNRSSVAYSPRRYGASELGEPSPGDRNVRR
jgi:outer membrane receptor protein involved in Fe transport